MVNWPYFTFLAQIVVSQGTFEAPPWVKMQFMEFASAPTLLRMHMLVYLKIFRSLRAIFLV